MKKLEIIAIHLVLCSPLTGGDINYQDQYDHVEQSDAEKSRLRLVRVLGDPLQYDFLIIDPNERYFVLALKILKDEKAGLKSSSMEVVFWAPWMREDEKLKSTLVGDECEELLSKIGKVFESPERPSDSDNHSIPRINFYKKLDDLGHPTFGAVSVVVKNNKKVDIEEILRKLWPKLDLGR